MLPISIFDYFIFMCILLLFSIQCSALFHLLSSHHNNSCQCAVFVIFCYGHSHISNNEYQDDDNDDTEEEGEEDNKIVTILTTDVCLVYHY